MGLVEYYIYATNDCNLNCSFCSNQQKRAGTSGQCSAEEIAGFVLRDIEIEDHKNNSIVFYGGEPMLNQAFLKDFIKKTENNNLTFLSFTNGTLLDSIDPFLLEKLSVLLVSVDGEHRLHDKFRGAGTFERLIRNVFAVRSRFGGKTVARLCFTPGYSLYSSVLGVVNWFDNVYWQIENSPSALTNPSECLSGYSKDLDLLINYWIDHLKDGIMKNIIPFQAVVSSILLERKSHSFRCGAGSRLMAIDTSGNCFVCDDLIGGQEFRIGDVRNGVNRGALRQFSQNISCSGCGIKEICGGRCLRAWRKFPEKTAFYCSTTNTLVSKLKERIPEIKELIEAEIISGHDLDNPISRFTEEIP